MTDIESLSEADYASARLRALFGRVIDALSGESRRLLSFEEVKEALHLAGPVYRGVQTVPVDRIVGSLNRYRDFDHRFLPTQSHTQARWTRINRAWYRELHLPPVLLYQVGEVYFVVDGNHRVSVARAQGQTHIDAEVRECASRVPLAADVEPEDIERLGARVEFLERTQIDRLLPQAEVEPTILGGYDRLVEHIAVHRYFMGLEQKREISESEAVLHWYETLYLPVTQVVRASGVLEEFPGRTPADLYLWVMDHLHYLRSLPGQRRVDAREAARQFIEMID
ncbi:MAG TPA: hypothetical protein VFI11_07205 [Anaerolineales bacterium]|nr:hypothetical protein [Anaerolineales bacterium]